MGSSAKKATPKKAEPTPRKSEQSKKQEPPKEEAAAPVNINIDLGAVKEPILEENEMMSPQMKRNTE